VTAESGGSERPEAAIGVVDERHAQASGGDLDVHVGAVEGTRRRNADFSAAESFGFGLPTSGGGEVGTRYRELVEDHGVKYDGFVAGISDSAEALLLEGVRLLVELGPDLVFVDADDLPVLHQHTPVDDRVLDVVGPSGIYESGERVVDRL